MTYRLSASQVEVWRGLTRGYGVEDIAVRSGLHLDRVRLIVRAFQAKGQLDGIVAVSRRDLSERLANVSGSAA